MRWRQGQALRTLRGLDAAGRRRPHDRAGCEGMPFASPSNAAMHHDALEFPDGQVILLTRLCEGQRATVLQLPAAPGTAEEAGEQKRVSVVV